MSKTSRRPIVVGVTGAMGSGKSYVCDLLGKQGIPCLNTDVIARDEMLTNRDLQHALSSLSGHNLLSPNGQLDKAAIRAYLSKGQEQAERLDALVHPAVRLRVLRWRDQLTCRVAAVECALLLESHFDDLVDYVVVVGAPESVRLERVCRRDGLTEAQIRRFAALQMTQEEKLAQSDFVIDNSGQVPLEPQLDLLLTASGN